MQITTLIENNSDERGQLLNEHGLSLYIEADGLRILFDTGQSGDFIDNAIMLNKDLDSLDYIMISHGHYDHSGGFERLVDKINKLPKLIVGADFFESKYKVISEQEYKYIGNSFNEDYIVQKEIDLKKVEDEIFYLTDNIMVFHHFIRKTDFEKRNDKFFIKKDKIYIHDEFEDEIALGIVTDKGLIVIVGCSHPGIINILTSISEKVNIPIYAVIGGTHLIEADEIRMQKTIEAFKTMEIQLIGVSHCTGEAGIKRIQREFPDKFIYNNTGNITKF